MKLLAVISTLVACAQLVAGEGPVTSLILYSDPNFKRNGNYGIQSSINFQCVNVDDKRKDQVSSIRFSGEPNAFCILYSTPNCQLKSKVYTYRITKNLPSLGDFDNKLASFLCFSPFGVKDL